MQIVQTDTTKYLSCSYTFYTIQSFCLIKVVKILVS